MGIVTIGHSTRELAEFLGLLHEFRIGLLVDIRRFPSSRRFPHFDRVPLERALAAAGIEYRWEERMGGRRHGRPRADSPNTGLRSEGFRNYADHMATEEFRRAAEELIVSAERRAVAIMCAERLFWKCHRRLVSDYLVARGIPVRHILDPGEERPHRLSPEARPCEGGVVYPLV